MRNILIILLSLFGFCSPSCAQNDTEQQVLAGYYQAIQYFLSGNHEAAIPLVEDVVAYYEGYAKEDVIDKASACSFLCNSYMSVGRMRDAEALYLQTINELNIADKTNEKVYRNLLDGLSILYFEVHNYQKASDYSEQAKILFENNLDFGDGYIACLSNMAIIQLALGNLTLAKLCIDVAVRQARTDFGDNSKMANGLSDIANIVGVNVDKEVLEQQSSIRLKLHPVVSILSNAAHIYQELGYIGDAVQLIKESIKICEVNGIENAAAYNNLAALYLSQSRYEEAITYYEQAYQKVKTPSEYNQIAFNLALTKYWAKDKGVGELASNISYNMRQHIGDAFTFLSTDERYNYWKHYEDFLPFLNLMIYESADNKYFGSIYDNILEEKGLLLFSSNKIKNAVLTSQNADDIAAYQQMLAYKQQNLTEQDPAKKKELLAKIEEIDKRLTRNVAQYGQLNKKCDWKQIKEKLSDDEIAIEFYYYEDTIRYINVEPRFCAVIVKKGIQTPQIVPLCTESHLDSIDKENYYLTTDLYDAIWKPIANELKGIKRIFFAPYRDLHQIAIEYVLAYNGKRINELYDIHRLSSTREIVEPISERSATQAVLYGGLKYDLDIDDLIAESRSINTNKEEKSANRYVGLENYRYGVKYLPGTLSEIKEIGTNMDDESINHLDITGEFGTEESLKALSGQSINILHLATHGFYWNEKETAKRRYVTFMQRNKDTNQSKEDKALMRSGLFFSGANLALKGVELPNDVEDGVLTAKELAALNLGNIDLVVLSACQSGLGEVSSDGVFGLQRGFKLAGANTLLMSLWPVDDTATQLLMMEFYKYFLHGETKTNALRHAQQHVKSQQGFESPEYWAGFILLDALN